MASAGRPTSQGNVYQKSYNMNQSYVSSPQNQNIMLQNKNKSYIKAKQGNTETTNANSDGMQNPSSSAMPHKQ